MMKKKKLIIFLGIVIIGIIGISVFFFVNQGKITIPGITPSPTPTPEQEEPNMILMFDPNTLTVSENASFSANVLFDTYGNSTDGVTLVISYDPNAISNVKISPVKDATSALSYALFPYTSSEDMATGMISQSFGISENLPEQKGSGIIAKVTGRLNSGIESTIIRIDASSSATSRELERVVLGKVNLDITAR